MSYQKKGGEARAASLSAEQRKEIATKAAASRWDISGIDRTATHIGDLRIGDATLPCAVLDDGTRVLSAKSVFEAFGRERRSNSRNVIDGIKVPAFIDAKNLQPFINQSIIERIKLVEYLDGNTKKAGYVASILPKMCELYLTARRAGALTQSQEKLAIQSEILLSALAEIGIEALVDEATGYQGVRAKDALQRLLDRYLNKELSAWVKRFPDEFYEQMYRLKGWEWSGMSRNRFSCVGNYTKDVVYERLAPELIEEMQRINPKDDTGNRKGKHHQLLTQDTGIPSLSQHFHLVLTLMRASSNWDEFKLSLDRFVPKKNANFLLDV
jgi:hypothetical protein